MITEKQKQVVKNLKDSNYNVSESMRKSGYTEQSVNSGTVRRAVRKAIQKYTRPFEEMKSEFLKDLDKDIKRFKKENDNGSLLRAKELKSKILALQVDRTEVKTQVEDKRTSEIQSLVDTYLKPFVKLT